jgi:four helix bundle protein
MAFDALEVALELIVEVKKVIAAVIQVDKSLADQMTRALNSIALNVGEGARRIRGDRLHLWRIADGSAMELRVAIRVALAWGHVDQALVAPSLVLLDRQLAMHWRMCRH